MESNDSPEIPDKGETSDIPGLPSGAVLTQVNNIHTLTQVNNTQSIKTDKQHIQY